MTISNSISSATWFDGAFVVIAENFNSFGNAIIKKSIADIAGAEPRQRA
jgi:hypothetical protein